VHATLLAYLACPACGGELKHVATGRESDDGELVCNSCGRAYPVLGGIPRLVESDRVIGSQARTASAFGWQWKHFAELHDEYEAQFLDWIYPLTAEFFRGKVVLDAGCGTGRHAYHAARFGASDVVAFDFSEAVDAARANLGELQNVHVLQADLLNPPFRADDETRMFDFVYCIGVLHHLPDPRAGFLSLSRFVRPGGTIFVWVYGYEGNEFVRTFVEPLRRLTTRLSPARLRAVAWPLSLALWAVVKLVYGPLRRTPLFRLLPVREYLASLAGFGFRQIYSIVFDQLVAPTSHYIKRSELEEWFSATGLEDVELSWRNRNSWRGRGRRPVSQRHEAAETETSERGSSARVP
jgi:SAM-dependent methyltransferase